MSEALPAGDCNLDQERLQDLCGANVSRETFDRLQRYAALLRDEASRQNLVSRGTLDRLWDRHILDSAQLVRFEPFLGASWVDIGSGAGLPGMVIAILARGPVTLIEPRRLRAEFLAGTAAALGLGERVTVFQGKAESAGGRFDLITARAVATLDQLLRISTHLSTGKTLWVLPKGRSAQSELAEAWRHWHCEAQIVASRTDPEAGILVLRNVKAKGGR
ncbi:MAG TPA: 16S rRNA (guanine(527)-N(7))-methyltransferase RsmG [Sphingomicrobium sp.]|nr:16S rRNA (guanine(527)-N(7))-methyltransferase RsmG [Sphingomicrobium sp.]